MGNKEELNGERDEYVRVGVRSWGPEVLGGKGEGNSGEGPRWIMRGILDSAGGGMGILWKPHDLLGAATFHMPLPCIIYKKGGHSIWLLAARFKRQPVAVNRQPL